MQIFEINEGELEKLESIVFHIPKFTVASVPPEHESYNALLDTVVKNEQIIDRLAYMGLVEEITGNITGIGRVKIESAKQDTGYNYRVFEVTDAGIALVLHYEEGLEEKENKKEKLPN